jgi:hypothetical protein
MDWWVTKGDRRPVGPVSTELLLQGIGAGKVPRDALVCEVGGTSWKCIGELSPFSIAFGEHGGRRRLDSESERTPLDPCGEDVFLSRFDDAPPEHTLVDRAPAFRQSEPPARATLHAFDDADDKTIADAVPLRTSEPPTKP